MDSLQQTFPISSPAIDFQTVTTTLRDSATVMDTLVAKTTQQLQQRDRDLTRAQRRENCARQWLLAIRRSHRVHSHQQTTVMIRCALRELTSETPRFPYLAGWFPRKS